MISTPVPRWTRSIPYLVWQDCPSSGMRRWRWWIQCSACLRRWFGGWASTRSCWAKSTPQQRTPCTTLTHPTFSTTRGAKGTSGTGQRLVSLRRTWDASVGPWQNNRGPHPWLWVWVCCLATECALLLSLHWSFGDDDGTVGVIKRQCHSPEFEQPDWSIP